MYAKIVEITLCNQVIKVTVPCTPDTTDVQLMRSAWYILKAEMEQKITAFLNNTRAQSLQA